MGMNYFECAEILLKMRGENSNWTYSDIRYLLSQYDQPINRIRSLIRSMETHDCIQCVGIIPYTKDSKVVLGKVTRKFVLLPSDKWIKPYVVEW